MGFNERFVETSAQTLHWSSSGLRGEKLQPREVLLSDS